MIKVDVWKWLCDNSFATTEELLKIDQSGFWIRAAEPSDETTARENAEITLTTSVKNISISSHTGTVIVRFRSSKGEQLLTAQTDEVEECLTEHSEFSCETAPFLLNLLFCIKTGVAARSKIPARALVDWAKSGALADDIAPYLPALFLVTLHGEHAAYTPKLLATLLSCEVSTRPASELAWLHDDICALALRIPDSDHDWLYTDISNAANSRQLDYTFLLIYRVLEFLFPMPGINSLRGSADIKESHLSLLYKCQSELNWFWKHDSSARGLARVVGSARFMEPLKESGLVALDSDPENCAAKIVGLRNQLAHQSYRASSIERLHLQSVILSCTILCTDAFELYGTWGSRAPAQ